MVLRIFLKLLKPQSPTVVFYNKNKIKIHVDSYVNRKDYFDKYFGRSTILIIFILQKDYFGLKNPICLYTLLQGQCLKQSSTNLHCSINVGFLGKKLRLMAQEHYIMPTHVVWFVCFLRIVSTTIVEHDGVSLHM